MSRGRNKSYRNRGGYRGSQSPERGRFGRGRGRSNNLSNEIDIDIQQWSDGGGKHLVPCTQLVQQHSVLLLDYGNRAFGTPRGIGRGRLLSQPNSGTASPRGRGGRGGNVRSLRGRGNWYRSSKAGQDIPLSQLLYETRPYLRPVKFVRSVYNKTLFDEVEDILQGSAENEGWSSFFDFGKNLTLGGH
jgi:hypothetical protein